MSKRAHSLSGKYLTPAFDHHAETLDKLQRLHHRYAERVLVPAIQARHLPGGGGDSPIFGLINQK